MIWPGIALGSEVGLGIQAASSGSSDASWSSVGLLLANDSKGNGTVAFADQSNNGFAITVNGQVNYDTSQFPTGLSSSAFFDGTGDFLDTPSDAAFGFGAGDFTVECFTRVSSLASARGMMSIGSATPFVFVYVDSAGALTFFDNAAIRIVSGAAALVVNTWYHVALCKASGSTKLFLAGTQVGSTYADSNNYGTPKVFRTGANSSGTQDMLGWIASVRSTKGVARYTANFTPPTPPLPTATT